MITNNLNSGKEQGKPLQLKIILACFGVVFLCWMFLLLGYSTALPFYYDNLLVIGLLAGAVVSFFIAIRLLVKRTRKQKT